ncbi:MAG: acyl carrier protein [Oscillospiraceae bacterium]|jgi:acyl carrier protein|nr:acyl carrier protein [Oscillospiraceae bacterium]
MSNTEQRVYDIWRDVLETEELEPDKSFFDLGGNSILLMKAQARLEKEFSCKISIPDLFTYPTVDKLAQYIDTVMQKV